MAWLKAMAWDLRGNMEDEVQRGLMSARLTPGEIDQLYPPYPYGRHRPIVDQGAVVGKRFEQDARAAAHRESPSRPPLGAGERARAGRVRRRR